MRFQTKAGTTHNRSVGYGEACEAESQTFSGKRKISSEASIGLNWLCVPNFTIFRHLGNVLRDIFSA